ncbi:hypothetical protein N7499_010735 [Penicillium canescens]|uniref:Ubiquitin-activating enzyme E1-like n=1 Tax=Penicillium canescens TaxID=5083 RepID=A0AAD6NC85_PENCN|nr:uncharacterized protein N7446_006003 [Penicillium canescens]KAJ5990208.1 hypothetical protein N7522_010415 [Penicillium canescens]KAJ6051371.1 hypothetical protein N7460_001905 [Penicillium canescens]KAJ6061883.1 hypothetical protein N7446_006003 [Penicillium canescens]KAJ6065133.1 hypothetical protein N7444_000786 [Penicillium canescens]KAJ6068848.1 hypothetical protein N7499_010735 [Penicillium canescens]
MRDSSVKRSLGADLTTKVKTSRVLLVGAGGIGCELLKNLVLTGFGEIHIVDLDTIDLSNLNRQFLFRHEHIKKSKALVAKEVAQKFRPDAKLEAYHDNIMDKQFSHAWFQSFTVVFNALDNLAARRHVNRMCLAAGVPLIESGTTGFNGQVQVIRKGETECYDCTPKEVPKTFAICTIRSTPSQPIHCIVWAKSWLLPELFGNSEDEAADIQNDENADNATEIAELRKEAFDMRELREALGTDEGYRKVFQKVFGKDIERLRTMKDMWKTRQKPQLLDFDTLDQTLSSIDPAIATKDQEAWTIEENFAVFQDSFNRLSNRLKELRAEATGGQAPFLTFDKDDVDTLDFVAATANLRAIIFHIETKSKFDIKQMAGNIIPAIATTNAMTAGLCVLQSFKVLQQDMAHAKTVFLERSGARAINSESLNPPNPNCPVCSLLQVRVEADPEVATVNDLVEGVLRMELGYKDLSIYHGTEEIYESSELEDNLEKKLSHWGIGQNSFLKVTDNSEEDARVDIEIIILEKSKPSPDDTVEVKDSKPAKLQEMIDIPLQAEPQTVAQRSSESAASTNGETVTGKRKREGSSDLTNEHNSKRVASGFVPGMDSNGPIVLDDDEEGAILIDD